MKTTMIMMTNRNHQNQRWHCEPVQPAMCQLLEASVIWQPAWPGWRSLLGSTSITTSCELVWLNAFMQSDQPASQGGQSCRGLGECLEKLQSVISEKRGTTWGFTKYSVSPTHTETQLQSIQPLQHKYTHTIAKIPVLIKMVTQHLQSRLPGSSRKSAFCLNSTRPQHWNIYKPGADATPHAGDRRESQKSLE